MMNKKILLNLHLPKINGLEVLKCIRTNEQTYQLPVVVLTDSRNESDMSTSFNHGANSYISKPKIKSLTELDCNLSGCHKLGCH